MKKLFLLLFLVPVLASAQQGRLMIQGSTGNLYLKHTTAPKENFYSIGRLYNISPKEFAPYNNLALDKGLSLGKEIKIPLTGNFIQSPVANPDETAVPLYHKATAAETLAQVSAHYNKVPVASLRLWNNLNSDALKPGQEIIVGYLAVKKELSAFAANGVLVQMSKEEMKSVPETGTKTTTIPVTIKGVETNTVQEIPVVKPNPVVEEKKTVEKMKTVDKPVVEKTEKKEFSEYRDKEGVFKTQFTGSGREQSGMAGIFKSTSGREDAKYYCLQNTIPPGTVIRVINTATGKSIYAKVLDMMPDLKKNEGLTLLLSDAAADALGGSENNFMCTINY